MLLEFTDAKRIEIQEIFGGPKLINGVMRDTLRIELSPTAGYTLEQLKTMFKDPQNCRTLYSYAEELTDSGTVTMVRNMIGEGYCLFCSVSDEERLIKYTPGLLRKPEIEEVYVVTIAQYTFDEYIKEFGVAPPSSM